MIRRTLTTASLVAGLALMLGVVQPAAAQEVVMVGGGPERMCNPVIQKDRSPVHDTRQDIVQQKGTYSCPEPEPVPVVEPAAPPPLPERGVIYFDFDKAELNPEAQAVLDDIIFDIKDRSLGGIIVQGHTDTAGPAEYNMKLSQARANTVAQELIKAGIPAEIVTTEAYGETQLAVPTPDGVPDAANRRVVIDFKPPTT